MLGIFTAISTLATTWLAGRNEKQKAKIELDKAEVENKARLLRDTNVYNKEWEIAQLRDKDKSLRWLSFIIIASPFVVAIFDPDAVHYYFTVALSGVPNWWIKAFMGIMGAIWGLSSLKNITPAIISSFKRKSK
ncbi:hypothetical protein LCGC14_1007280 [marine sediment metagenome]|uniref:Uncharacterized protein n=1 Tax=marine sediment metagenome TaxID=412755 RepID=A0A0F9QJM0_9ZZZZ